MEERSLLHVANAPQNNRPPGTRREPERDAPSQEDSDATSHRKGWDRWCHKKPSYEYKPGLRNSEKRPRPDDRSEDAPWKEDHRKTHDREIDTCMKRPRNYDVSKGLEPLIMERMDSFYLQEQSSKTLAKNGAMTSRFLQSSEYPGDRTFFSSPRPASDLTGKH